MGVYHIQSSNAVDYQMPRIEERMEEDSAYRTLSVNLPGGPFVHFTMLGLLLLMLAPAVVNGQRGVGISGDTSPYKGFSGFRLRPDSARAVYYHEQTIAVTELGINRILYNCELIEVYTPLELKMTLKNLSSTVSKPRPIVFEEMLHLMELCEQISTINRNKETEGRTNVPRHFVTKVGAVSLFKGIIPGTKWCGAGDLADTYFDLGDDASLDKCCRTHDLCPIKVKSYATRYNLTNNSIYTKSHCSCDLNLYNCLKETKNPTADIMGTIYFNFLQVPCIRKSKTNIRFQDAKHY